jgi:hypothetical protein
LKGDGSSEWRDKPFSFLSELIAAAAAAVLVFFIGSSELYSFIAVT